MEINYSLLPLKAHYFFFTANLGALPFLLVYGKQLGVSPLVMGTITTILPILWMIGKPTVGFIMDYFQSQKKFIFITILVVSSTSYILLYFLPSLPGPMIPDQFHNVSCASLSFCEIDSNSSTASCDGTKNVTCHWVCKNANFSLQLLFHAAEKEAVISPNTTCLININDVSLCQENYNCNITCDSFENNYCLYASITFWGFVLLMSLASVGIWVSYSINDAICFEILGKGGEMKFGKQRVWGDIGYGLSGFLVGYTVDIWSQGKIYKTYTSAFLLVFIFSCFDLISCKKLKLPLISRSTNIFTELCALLKYKSIVIFLCFVIIVGAIDGYAIHFLLWYEEELAAKTGYMGEINLIEGLTLAAEAFSCVVFFPLTGKILKKLGYGYTFTLALVFYALRLGLASLAPTPWWIVPIELLLLGPAYVLSYVTIVAFANAISSSSVAISVQGIISGMKEGFGFAIGNLIGSILMKKFGSALTLQIFSIFTALSAILYHLLYIMYLKDNIPVIHNNIEWRMSDDARRHCTVEE